MKVGIATPSAASVSPGITRRFSPPWLLGLTLAAAGALAYANSFRGVFIFDDDDSIANNRTIRNLAQPALWLHPPGAGITVSGRPGLNLSLALNWAWSGDQVWSYHLFNLAGHLAAGLILFELVRRTLLRLPAFAPAAAGLAWAVALLWTLHPLQTEAVSYVVQRAEMLMGLCYLGALLGLVRAAEATEASRPVAATGWSMATVAICAFGMTCKEVMVSAPVILLLFDRTFLSGTFAAAWRARRGLWLALASTWSVLFFEVLSTDNRGGTAGFGAGLNFFSYLLTQGPAIVRYWRLTFWPHPLVLDYGVVTRWVDHPWSVLPANLAVAAAAVASLVALWRAPRWGFLGFWFFSILAPTSLVPGARQTLAEHRMYLALAPLLAALVLASWRWLRDRPGARRWAVGGVGLIALAEGAVVWGRNAEFRSAETLWRLDVQAAPDNPYAHINLGGALYLEGKRSAAQAEFIRAVQLDPNSAPAESNLGLTYQTGGQPEEAIVHFRRALQLKPGYAQAVNNLGVAFGMEQRWTEAAAAYTQALQWKPDYPDAERNLGMCERIQGHLASAELHLRRAVDLGPGDARNWYELGVNAQSQGKNAEAARAYAEAVRQRPDYAEAHASWAALLAVQNQPRAALEHLNTAVALDPANPEVLINRAIILAAAGKAKEAAEDYARVIRLRPNSATAWANLGLIAYDQKNLTEALADLRRAVQLDPSSPQAHYDLGLVFDAVGNRPEAAQEYLASLRLAPDLAEPRNNLANEYAATGDYAKACDQFKELIRRHPDHALAHLNLGRIYGVTGQTEEGRRELERAQQLGAPAANFASGGTGGSRPTP